MVPPATLLVKIFRGVGEQREPTERANRVELMLNRSVGERFGQFRNRIVAITKPLCVISEGAGLVKGGLAVGKSDLVARGFGPAALVTGSGSGGGASPGVACGRSRQVCRGTDPLV